jgi:hypothetical protein
MGPASSAEAPLTTVSASNVAAVSLEFGVETTRLLLILLGTNNWEGPLKYKNATQNANGIHRRRME